MKTEYLTYIFYFFVLFLAWKLLQKFGVLESGAERKQKKSSRTSTNPDTWKKTAKKQPLSTTEVNDIATILYESKGVFVDDESTAVAAIKRVKTKEQASFLSAYFAKKYKKDLASYMNYLDDENKTLFFDYLNSLK